MSHICYITNLKTLTAFNNRHCCHSLLHLWVSWTTLCLVLVVVGAEGRLLCLLRPGDNLESIILTVMKEIHEDESNCTAFLKPSLVSCLLTFHWSNEVEWPRPAYMKVGKILLAKVIKRAKDENFESLIQRYQDSQYILIPILETRGLATAPRSFSRWQSWI